MSVFLFMTFSVKRKEKYVDKEKEFQTFSGLTQIEQIDIK